jgi:hypothetical protein
MVVVRKAKRLLEAKKPQCHNMGFYVINNALVTLLEVNSSHPKLEQLICVFCYPIVVAHVGFGKGGITIYKSANRISTL